MVKSIFKDLMANFFSLFDFKLHLKNIVWLFVTINGKKKFNNITKLKNKKLFKDKSVRKMLNYIPIMFTLSKCNKFKVTINYNQLFINSSQRENYDNFYFC